MEADLLG